MISPEVALNTSGAEGIGCGLAIFASVILCRFVECNVLEETLPQALTADAPFSMALDSAAFHCSGGEEEQRRYASNLASVVQPSGHLVLLAHSDRNGESNDPRMRRVTEASSNGLAAEVSNQ
mmetsp:Transcript_96419/g.245011  ORF Transcript_96419/g.245011 Transcript_96419/m.245011 type:complete len:122 (+) Transcript_96419:60-425(+)